MFSKSESISLQLPWSLTPVASGQKGKLMTETHCSVGFCIFHKREAIHQCSISMGKFWNHTWILPWDIPHLWCSPPAKEKKKRKPTTLRMMKAIWVNKYKHSVLEVSLSTWAHQGSEIKPIYLTLLSSVFSKLAGSWNFLHAIYYHPMEHVFCGTHSGKHLIKTDNNS